MIHNRIDGAFLGAISRVLRSLLRQTQHFVLTFLYVGVTIMADVE